MKRALSTRIIVAFIFLLLYTYQILAEASFLLVECVQVDNTDVLYIDGNIECYQEWQYFIFAFIGVFVVPFFIPIAFSPYLLYKRVISLHVFLFSFILPLPFSPYLIMKRILMRTANANIQEDETVEENSSHWCHPSKATINEVSIKHLSKNIKPFLLSLCAYISDSDSDSDLVYVKSKQKGNTDQDNLKILS